MIHEKYGEDLLSAVKIMDPEELAELSEEIRERILETVSKNGGHLASNLGAVELTLAIHRVFDSPKDKIIWDVGHQTYVHKMLTGRWEEMDSLRQLDGISGFPKRGESIHDAYDSGHSGTSISAALGYAKARDLNGDAYSCVAVIGDGAMTGGVAFEALSSAGSSKTPLIVILNENSMSIGKNVGGIAKYLGNLRTSKKYINLKENVKRTFSNMPAVYSGLEKFRDSLRKTVVPETIFDDLGFKYYGPIDGHNIQEMCAAFEVAKIQTKPVLVHVITKKGKGFEPAETNPTKYHGIGPFDISSADRADAETGNSWSDVFGAKLLEMASKDEKIVAITAAMLNATGLSCMNSIFPDRVFDAAIAEQNAVSFAAGLSLGGMKPVVAIYSTFLQRAYDQIVTEVCLQNLPVVFAIDRAGVTGQDGETHQGVFDISYLRSMPNMTILSPSNKAELEESMEYALSLGTPCAIRYPRGKAEEIEYPGQNTVPLTKPVYVRKGWNILFITSGSMVKTAVEAAEIMEKKGFNPAVINFRTLKPFSEKLISDLAQQYNSIITLEDGCVMGGFGQEIASICSKAYRPPRVLNLGWPDKFIEHGTIRQLAKRYGLDGAGVARRTEEFI